MQNHLARQKTASGQKVLCRCVASKTDRLGSRAASGVWRRWGGRRASRPNIYAYVGGNPINAIDPLGLFGTDGAFDRYAGAVATMSLQERAALGGVGLAIAGGGALAPAAITATGVVARQIAKNLNFDGPRPSKTKPGEGMVCQVRYKQQPVFRIDVHPIDPVDRTPVPHFHIAPDMKPHRELPSFLGDWLKGKLGGGGN